MQGRQIDRSAPVSEMPIYADVTCNARRSGDECMISIGASIFRVERAAATKLAEQLKAALAE